MCSEMRTDVLGGVWIDDPWLALLASALIVAVFSCAHSVLSGDGEVVQLGQRGGSDRVAEGVRVGTPGEGRTGLGLDGDDARGLPLAQLGASEWERQPREVRAAADAADHDVGVLTGDLKLLQRLLADDG